jgi:hypothetical protein
MERWLSEIKLRADVRIGEISKGLETGKAAGWGKGKEVPSGGKFKAEALKDASPPAMRCARTCRAREGGSWLTCFEASLAVR